MQHGYFSLNKHKTHLFLSELETQRKHLLVNQILTGRSLAQDVLKHKGTRCLAAALCCLWRKDTWLESLVGQGQEIDGVWHEPEMRLFVELILDGQTVVDTDRWLEEFSSEVADDGSKR
jgi:hypothetical protein